MSNPLQINATVPHPTVSQILPASVVDPAADGRLVREPRKLLESGMYGPDGDTRSRQASDTDESDTFSSTSDHRDKRAGASSVSAARGRQPVLSASTKIKLHGNDSTAGDVLSDYGAAVWKVERHPSPGTATYENLRREAVKAVGGHGTPLGSQLADRFRLMYRQLANLKAAVGEYLLRYPRYRAIIEDTADSLKNTFVSNISGGMMPGDAAGMLRYYLETRIESAQAAERQTRRLAQQAEQRTQEQIQGIQRFWGDRKLTNTEEHLEYMRYGRMTFMSQEEMEDNCPSADYVRTTNPFISTAVAIYELRYGGDRVQNVFLRQEDGSDRGVVFRGNTWYYTNEEPESDRQPAAGLHAADAHRHHNARWNPDPRVVQARVNGSVEAARVFG